MWAGLEADRNLHGVGLPALLGQVSTPWRDGVMLQHYGLHQPILQRAWRTERWKLILQEDGFQELYDLIADPAEMINLAGDPAHADRSRQLQDALFADMIRLGDDGTRQQRLMNAAITN